MALPAIHSAVPARAMAKFSFPAMSPTMTEGGITQWKKAEGESFSAGDVLLEIETDKATMDVEAQDDGILAKILVPDGSKEIQVNSLIAIIAEEGDDISSVDEFVKQNADSESAPEVESKQTLPQSESSEPDITQPKKSKSDAVPEKKEEVVDNRPTTYLMASPAAKKVAMDRGVKLSSVKGTGPDGRILKSDVESFEQSQSSSSKSTTSPKTASSAASAPVTSWEDIPMTPMRKVIARRLTESFQTAPHFSVSTEIAMDKVMELRALFNAASEKKEAKLSVGDFITKAVAQALQDVPEVNAALVGDSIRMYKKQDICIAVATPTGLITPIITDVGSRGLASISAETKAMAAKGRDGKLKPEEYQGGSFTISNLGMYGVSHFTAILNPPQSAILAVGSALPKVVMTADGTFEQIHVMTATLTSNHAVVDGAVAAQFQKALKTRLENPLTLML